MKPFFPGKLIFAQIWANRAQNDPQLGFFNFFLIVFSFSRK